MAASDTSGGITGTQAATIVNNSGTITGSPAINQGSSVVLYVDNKAGGTIEGNVEGAAFLSFGVRNAGTIDGHVFVNDNVQRIFSATTVYYIADGGTAESVQLGTTGYSSANFIQIGTDPGTDAIDAGNGLDIYTKSYDATQSVALGGYTLPSSFEIEGYLVSGEDTTLTLTGAGTTISLMGNGNVVNNGTIDLVDTTGAYPVTVVPAAVNYFSVQQAPYLRQGPGQPTFHTIPYGSALASFTNQGEINGDIRIATASFTNNGDINLSSNGPGTVIRGAKDADFVFRNDGSIVMVNAGSRPGSTSFESEFERGVDNAVRITTALDATQLNAVTIENGEDGVISGGLSVSGVASTFTFTNDGTIAIGDNPFEIDRAIDINLGNFEIAQAAALREDAVSDDVTLTNNGTIIGGIEVEATTRALTFTNTGRIEHDPNDEEGAAVNLATDDWADTPDGEDVNDAESLTFLNSATGIIVGSVEIEAEASQVSITNGGSISQGVRSDHGVFARPSQILYVEQETALDASLAFTNSGVIRNEDYAGGAVFIDLEAGDQETGLPAAVNANATITINNTGSIIASGGNYLTLPGPGGMQPGQIGIDFSVALTAVADIEEEGTGVGSVSITNGSTGVIDALGLGHQWDGGSSQVVEVANQTSSAGGIAIAVKADTSVTIVNDGIIRGGPGGSLTLQNQFTLVPQDAGDVDFEGVWGGAIDTFGTSADTVTNTGLIQGGIALRSGNDTFTNSGTVNGTVYMGDGNDHVTAGGTFTGDIFMGAGNDVVVTALNGAGSRFSGTIDGGLGGDSFIFAVNNGGALEEGFAVDMTGFEFVALAGTGTVTSDGTAHATIQLAEGQITLAAGSTFNASQQGGFIFRGDAQPFVQTLLNEGTVNGSVSLGAGNDSFTNKGTFNGNLDLGDGDDTFAQAWNATFNGTADGGAGSDTFIFDLTGSTSTDTINLGIYDHLVNFEVLETRGTGGGSIVGDPETGGQYNLAGEIGSVTLGTGNDTVNNTGTVTGGVDLGGGTNQFTNAPGGAIEGGVQGGAGGDTVQNLGTITGTVALGEGANTFTNAPGGLITGAVESGSGNDQITNQGTIVGPVDLGDGNNQFTNATGATITGDVQSGSGADQLVNQGTINGDIYLDGNAIMPQAFASDDLTPADVTPVTGGDDTLTNEGVVAGSVYALSGNDRLTHSGTITGDVDMGDGDDTLALSGAWVIGGAITGGAGTDVLNLTFAAASSEAEPVVFDQERFTSFEKLEVSGGVGKIEGEVAFQSIGVTGGRLIGAADSVITANVDVGSGGTFGSAGKVVGDINVASGGTLSPGASPAVMTVVGDVSLANGSITTFEFIPAPGQSDQLLIDGKLTIASGATLNMTGERPLTPGTAYDMIVADNIDGTFTLGTWDHAAVQGFLRYVDGATEDRLQLMGTFVATADVTPTADLAIDYVNSLLISGQASNALLNAVPLLLNDEGYASTAAFSLLSPEPYASATQLGVERGLSLTKTFRSGFAQGLTPEARPFTFASGLGNWRTLKADPTTGASRAKSDGYGVLGGIGYGSESASVAAFIGYLDSDQKIAALGAKTKVDGMAAGITGHVASGGFEASALIAYDWGKGDTRRLVPGGAVASSDYRLRSFVLDAQVGYSFALSQGWSLQPAIGLTHVSTKRGSATESGNTAFALDVAGKRTNATFVDGGLKLQAGNDEGATFKPWVQLGLRHQLSGDRPWVSAGFLGTSPAFTVAGVDRKDTVITAGAGFSAAVSDTVNLFASYQGEFGGGTGSQANLGITIAF
ncbi:autotransporter domain-containing protein [Caenibius tardaugens]|uniref:autotransporter domain-containing protein n=1 Tax=Caenibius tardaugens TaxID=169176 RepID=UPI000F5DC30D|nr:autotransporter outer membrane beta-barrel domain-containing protein [Caenibius tardaugens]AZI35363.1 autotransporter outer membrane beta-barrel domain-containing protein [Caenibius tardaugens NBRC 16725]